MRSAQDNLNDYIAMLNHGDIVPGQHGSAEWWLARLEEVDPERRLRSPVQCIAGRHPMQSILSGILIQNGWEPDQLGGLTYRDRGIYERTRTYCTALLVLDLMMLKLKTEGVVFLADSLKNRRAADAREGFFYDEEGLPRMPTMDDPVHPLEVRKYMKQGFTRERLMRSPRMAAYFKTPDGEASDA